MASKEGLELILEEALKAEVAAEDNCEKILHEAKINGFANAVRHIENDEKRHQEMVKRLMSFLK